jgi:hypothetical protein
MERYRKIFSFSPKFDITGSYSPLSRDRQFSLEYFPCCFVGNLQLALLAKFHGKKMPYSSTSCDILLSC